MHVLPAFKRNSELYRIPIKYVKMDTKLIPLGLSQCRLHITMPNTKQYLTTTPPASVLSSSTPKYSEEVATTNAELRATSTATKLVVAVKTTRPSNTIPAQPVTEPPEKALCGNGFRSAVPTECWTEDYGGVRLCPDSHAVVLGPDGRSNELL